LSPTSRRNPPTGQQKRPERERQRAKQITDIANRFIQSVARQAIESMDIENLSVQYQAKIEEALESDNPAAALAALNNDQSFDPAKFKNFGAQVQAVTALVQGLGGIAPGFAEANALVAELRLILPSKVVHVAELVTTDCLLAQATSATPIGMRMPAGAVTAVLTLFVNAVREEIRS
jgi:hypothetical protein